MPGPPIRKPSDHSPPAGSPRNIAGHHVLHRPLMPRHPPNAQKNKQQMTHEQNKKQFCRRNLTVRCSRPLYSSQPTHPHPPTTPNNQEPQTGQATRAHCPRTPTACHPHTHQRTRGHPPPPNRAAASVSLMPAPDKPTTRENKPTRHSQLPGPSARADAQPAQTHSTVRARSKQPGSHPA